MLPPPPSIPLFCLLGKNGLVVALGCHLYHRKMEFGFTATTVENPYPCEIGLNGSAYLIWCEHIKSNHNMRSRLHVFADLQSYLCTHEACRDALKTFPSRALWADHEFNEHFTHKRWHCFMCNIKSSTKQSFIDHLIINHDISLTGHRLTAAISEAEENVLKPGFKDHECALCSQAGWQTRKEYATHVGQHLEEISLACLPRIEEDSSQIEPESPSSVTGYQTAMPNNTRAFSVGPRLRDSFIEAPGIPDSSSLATTDVGISPSSSTKFTSVTVPEISGPRSYDDFSSIRGQEEEESSRNVQQYGPAEHGAKDGLYRSLQELRELFDETVRGMDIPDAGPSSENPVDQLLELSKSFPNNTCPKTPHALDMSKDEEVIQQTLFSPSASSSPSILAATKENMEGYETQAAMTLAASERNPLSGVQNNWRRSRSIEYDPGCRRCSHRFSHCRACCGIAESTPSCHQCV